MSSEELREVLIQNWSRIMPSVLQIHDSYDFEVPDFIAADRSFMEVFNEVLHEYVEEEFIRKNVPSPNLNGDIFPTEVRLPDTWPRLTDRQPSKTTSVLGANGFLGRTRRIGGGINSVLQATASEQVALREEARLSVADFQRILQEQETTNRQAELRFFERQIMEAMAVPQEYFGQFPERSEIVVDSITGLADRQVMTVTEGRSTSQVTMQSPEALLREWIEATEWEIVARKTATKSKKAVEKNSEPVYIWAFQSSKPRAGGAFITYETRLEENGETRCNCPGWIFKKSSEDRGCKHTKQIEDEAKTFFKMYKKGEQLPTVEMTPEQMKRFLSNPKKTESDVGKFGRVLDID